MGGFAAVAGGAGVARGGFATDGGGSAVEDAADVGDCGGVVLVSLGPTLVLGAAWDTGAGTGISGSVRKSRVPPHIASNITTTAAMAGTIKRRLLPVDSCGYDE